MIKGEMMIAVIAGASGLVGSLLIEQLIHAPEIKKIINVGRRPYTNSNSKVQDIVITDLSELKNIAGLLKGDVYFCALGTTIKNAGSKDEFMKIDHDAIIEFAKIASTHNAKCFSFISATGANEKSPLFYNKVKGLTEKAVMKIPFKRLVIMRPALLIGERKEFRAMENVAIKTTNVISLFLPAKVTKKFGTQAKELAVKMFELGIKDKEETLILTAENI